MGIPRDRVYAAASALLETARDYYVDNGEEWPDRYYVSPGIPAWDCEQAVAYVERTFSGLTDQETFAPIDCLVVRSATIVVEIARCVPGIQNDGLDNTVLPTVDQEDTAAQLVLADPVLLVNAAVDGYRAGLLSGCRGLAVVEWESIGPEGGVAGGRQRFRWLLTEG